MAGVLLGWLWASCIFLDQTVCILANLRALIKAISGCCAASLACSLLSVPSLQGLLKTRDRGGVTCGVTCTRLAPLQVNTHSGVWVPYVGWGPASSPTEFDGTRTTGSRGTHLHLLSYRFTPKRLCRTHMRAWTVLNVHSQTQQRITLLIKGSWAHTGTTQIPTSQPACVKKQRLRWGCQLMKFPSPLLVVFNRSPLSHSNERKLSKPTNLFALLQLK